MSDEAVPPHLFSVLQKLVQVGHMQLVIQKASAEQPPAEEERETAVLSDRPHSVDASADSSCNLTYLEGKEKNNVLSSIDESVSKIRLGETFILPQVSLCPTTFASAAAARNSPILIYFLMCNFQNICGMPKSFP